MRFELSAVLVGVLCAAAASADEPSRTRENLLLAWEEDLNEQQRYLAFAEQAEREGHLRAARLFRANAEAERIRGEGHARALRRGGAEPRVEVQPVEIAVATTRANLLRTLAHESRERRRAYADRAEQARFDGDADAALGFILGGGAHEGLVRLYQEAIRDLDDRTGDAGEALYVCRTCGHVSRGHAPDPCPVSLSSSAAFTRVD